MGKSRDVKFDYEITVVDGERGRRLAAVQTAAILEVLEWLYRSAKASAEGHRRDTHLAATSPTRSRTGIEDSTRPARSYRAPAEETSAISTLVIEIAAALSREGPRPEPRRQYVGDPPVGVPCALGTPTRPPSAPRDACCQEGAPTGSRQRPTA